MARINRGLHIPHSPALVVSDQHHVNGQTVLGKQFFFFISALIGLYVAVRYFFFLFNFTLGH